MILKTLATKAKINEQEYIKKIYVIKETMTRKGTKWTGRKYLQIM